MLASRGETVTRLRATEGTDGYGVKALSWTSPSSLTLSALVALGGTLEPAEDARNSVRSDLDLYVLEPDPDVTAEDRMIVRGLTCEVQGRPFTWRLGSWAPGAVIRCKIVEG